MINSRLGMSGNLQVKHIKPAKAPLSWRLKNTLRWGYINGWLGHLVARAVSSAFPILTVRSELSAIVIKADGRKIDYGVIARRVITDTGVAFLVDDWDSDATDITTLNYHGCGTGVAAEDQTDTALGTESTTILNPDSTRATGTKSQPASNQLRSVGTLTFDGAGAITEHGLFSQAATGGGVLWDRSVFSAINVAALDSIQFTYTMTASAGG